MKRISTSLIIISLMVFYSCGPSQNTDKSKEDETSQDIKEKPSVYFENLSNGDSVQSPFLVKMGLTGMEIQPAGEVNEGFGHHHILINMESWPEGEIIPPTDTTIHFGKGQVETELTLDPGSYTIALQFADGVHRSYGESMSASVGITVK